MRWRWRCSCRVRSVTPSLLAAWRRLPSALRTACEIAMSRATSTISRSPTPSATARLERDLELVLPGPVQVAGRTLGRRHVADRHRAWPDVAQPDPRHELLEVAHVARIARVPAAGSRTGSTDRAAPRRPAPPGSARPGTGRPPRARAARGSRTAPRPGGRTGRRGNGPPRTPPRDRGWSRTRAGSGSAASDCCRPACRCPPARRAAARPAAPAAARRPRRGTACRRRPARRRPSRAATAPVNAPRSCPKNSLPDSDGHDRRAVHDDQLPLPRPRVERVDRAAPTSSLPVPLSPVISTSTSLKQRDLDDVAQHGSPHRAGPDEMPRHQLRADKLVDVRPPLQPQQDALGAPVPRDDVGRARVQQLPWRVAGQRLRGRRDRQHTPLTVAALLAHERQHALVGLVEDDRAGPVAGRRDGQVERLGAPGERVDDVPRRRSLLRRRDHPRRAPRHGRRPSRHLSRSPGFGARPCCSATSVS